MYPKIVVLKAAYHFTERAYVHVDCDEDFYYITVEPKNSSDIDPKEFDNEILSQLTRQEIFEQTKDLREIALGRALATSMVEKNVESMDQENISADTILKDWYKTNE